MKNLIATYFLLSSTCLTAIMPAAFAQNASTVTSPSFSKESITCDYVKFYTKGPYDNDNQPIFLIYKGFFGGKKISVTSGTVEKITQPTTAVCQYCYNVSGDFPIGAVISLTTRMKNGNIVADIENYNTQGEGGVDKDVNCYRQAED